jgi:hypothetical protein
MTLAATPTKEVEACEDEHRDAIKHDVGNTTPIVPEPTQYSGKGNKPGMSHDTTLGIRRP